MRIDHGTRLTGRALQRLIAGGSEWCCFLLLYWEHTAP